MEEQPKIYYSLDIETSGFDPEKNEILEVGYVGFRVTSGKLKVESRFEIVEKWSKVFKPKAEVSHHVLGLTGLTSADLQKGGNILDELFFLQGKLGTAPIVGHNVGFDIKFLQKYGIKFSGPVIDTLDLVQFLLPTHHSYNLENLAHLFNIRHKNAHRALADALASMELLEKLLGVYQSLPEHTGSQIARLAGQVNAPWRDLLKAKIRPNPFKPSKLSKKVPAVKLGTVELKDREIYTVDPFVPAEEIISSIVNKSKGRLLVVVPKRYQALELWRVNLARGIFEPRHMFDPSKFSLLLKRDDLSADQARFLMKLIVWQATNWQKECLLDLNLSFFGGQFQGAVSGQSLPKSLPDRVLCCDQQTFLELNGSELFSDRSLVIYGLGEFEAAITATIGQRNSWGFLSYLLKSVYDPEIQSGQFEHKETISRLLSDADLFFGLTNALLLKFNKGWGDVSVADDLRNSEEFLKIMRAGENFIEKLSMANQSLKLKSLDDYCRSLGNFFEDQPGEVKWISFGEHTCSFHSLPLEISGVVSRHLSEFKNISFLEPRGEEIGLKYFIGRLGLDKFSVMPFALKSARKLTAVLKRKPACRIIPGADSSVVKLLGQANLPAVMIFKSPDDISQVYKKHYVEFQKRAFLLAEHSGGINKLFRNFSIHDNSLLLVSSQGVLNFLRLSQQVQPVSTLPAKTVIFAEWPQVQATDPYTKALAGRYNNPDLEFFLPRGIYDFQKLLRFFYSSKIKEVLILKPKKVFKYEDLYKNYLSLLFRVMDERSR